LAGYAGSDEHCALSGCFEVPSHGDQHIGGALLGAGVGLAASGVAALAVGWDGYEERPGMQRNDAAVTAGMMLTSLGSATLGAGAGMLIADGSRGDVFRGRTIGPLMVIGGVSTIVGIPVWLAGLDDFEPVASVVDDRTREPEDRSTAVGTTGVVLAAIGGAGAAASLLAGMGIGGLGGGFIAIFGGAAGGSLAVSSVPLMVMGYTNAPVGYEVRSEGAMGVGVTLLSLGTPLAVTGGALLGAVSPGGDGEPAAGTGLLIGGLTAVSVGLPLTIWGSWLVPEGTSDDWTPALRIGPGSGHITLRF
jgi:hypothetical protein